MHEWPISHTGFGSCVRNLKNKKMYGSAHDRYYQIMTGRVIMNGRVNRCNVKRQKDSGVD